jgi:hypothetical protein
VETEAAKTARTTSNKKPRLSISANLLETRGKNKGHRMTEREEIELFRICYNKKDQYGNKGEREGVTFFWQSVAATLKIYRNGVGISAATCKNRVNTAIQKRKAELLEEETGKEQNETVTQNDYTMALDAWIEVVDEQAQTLAERKQAKEKTTKEIEKAHRIRANLTKRRGEKRPIDSPDASATEDSQYTEDEGGAQEDRFSPIIDLESLDPTTPSLSSSRSRGRATSSSGSRQKQRTKNELAEQDFETTKFLRELLALENRCAARNTPSRGISHKRKNRQIRDGSGGYGQGSGVYKVYVSRLLTRS